jgi:hypothetical protein
MSDLEFFVILPEKHETRADQVTAHLCFATTSEKPRFF